MQTLYKNIRRLILNSWTQNLFFVKLSNRNLCSNLVDLLAIIITALAHYFQATIK